MREINIDLRGLSIAQRAFVLCDEPHPAFIAGFGSGKSHAGVVKSIMLALQNMPLPGMFVEPTFPAIRKTALPLFYKQLREYEIPYGYNKNEHVLTMFPKTPNATEIWLCSGHDPESLRGPTVAWACGDEIALMKREVWGEIIARVRHGEARTRKTFVTGTPDEYWVAELWEDDPKPGYVLFRSTPYENPANPDDYVKNIRESWPKEEIQRVIFGHFTRGGIGRAYKAFTREDHVTRVSPLDPNGKLSRVKHLPICLCCDFNVDPCIWLLLQHKNGIVYVYDEIVGCDTNTQEMTDRFFEDYYKKNQEVIVYGDPSGKARATSASKSDYAIMRKAGLTDQRIATSAPKVKDRILAVNAKLRNGAGKISLFVHPRCKRLIKDFEWVKYDKGGAGLDKSKMEFTHASDGLGYFVHRVYPIRKPVQRPVRVAELT